MLALMQDRPLMISSLIEHAAAFHPQTEIVSRSIEGPIVRSNWLTIRNRSKKVANALHRLGVQFGDRVGTLALNTNRHLELWYGITGMGAVLHTVNPRLFPAQVEYIVNHAENKALCFDISFASLVESLAHKLPTVEKFVAMTDRAHMPDIKVPNLLCYEELLEQESDEYEWPEFDEKTASCLCYTSGTTGNPKGVLYSHRSTVLHSLMDCTAEVFGIGARDSVLLVVPMFHANAWGVPYSGAMCGAKLVMPGAKADGQSLYELMRNEGCTFTQAVPTVWQMFFKYLDENPGLDCTKLKINRISTGGSATSKPMIARLEKEFGATYIQAWGMTEVTSIGAIGNLLPKHENLSPEELLDVKLKQGRAVWGVELKLVDDEGKKLPHDGKTLGHLYVRGPWITSGYFRGEGGQVLDKDGFFSTGDIATIDTDGYLVLVDRAKDVIKSGGEWISSIDLEAATLTHPAIAHAAVVGVLHAKWQERPLLLAIKREGFDCTREAIMDHLASRVAKWWLPDDVVFLEEFPLTATGKISKKDLRSTYKEHLMTKG